MRTITYNNKQITPSKIVCIGRNYVEHIKELNNEIPQNMVIFNKPNSSIANTLKYFSNDTRFEGEICFLIKDKKIDGIGFGLDLTKANIQNSMKKEGLPWERAKAFDSSAVFSEFISLKNKDISKLRMKLFINDELIQLATYDLMIYKPNDMVNEINSFMSLDDNDIVMSGTPKGVGTYKIGDKFVGQIYDENNLLLESCFVVEK